MNNRSMLLSCHRRSITFGKYPNIFPYLIIAAVVFIAQMLPLCALAGQPVAGVPRRLALLIGISKYPQGGAYPWRPLHTQRELWALRQVLISRFGFAASDVLLLEDQAATAAGIRHAVRSHLIARASAGATIYFHFSGHGQQVADQDGDEADGLDESLVPADAQDQRAEAGARVNIRDDEVGRWLKELEQRLRKPDGQLSGHILFTIDSCFAGTASRGQLLERGRGWEPILDGGAPAAAPSNKPASAPLSFVEGGGDYVFLSATQSDQTAKEKDGMGVFSRALVQSLETADAKATYRALFANLNSQVTAVVRNQNPQLEGRPDQPLLGGIPAATPNYPQIVRITHGQLIIPMGELQLITVGSTYTLHKPGAEPISESNRLARAEVVEVGAVESKLRLLPSSQRRIPLGRLRLARAVETEHNFAAQPLRLQLEAIAPLRSLVERLPFIHMESLGGYDVRLRMAGSRIELLRAETDRPFATVPVGDFAETRLADLLRAEWRYQQLLKLHHWDTRSQVELRLIPVSDSAVSSAASASSHVVLREGDRYRLELKNPTQKNLWVNVLELAPDGSIAPILPDSRGAGDNYIPAGCTQMVPNLEYQLTPPAGLSVFKVIATSERVDLSGIAQAGSPGGNLSVGEARGRFSLAALPPHWQSLGQVVAGFMSVERRHRIPVASSWGITETLLEQLPRR